MRSASDLRSELAKRRVYGYRVAARAHINASTFSRIINGRIPLSDAILMRILHAMDEEVRVSEAEETGGGDAA